VDELLDDGLSEWTDRRMNGCVAGWWIKLSVTEGLDGVTDKEVGGWLNDCIDW